MGNIISHIKNVTEKPIEWTIKHKFWLNSKYICTLLGISIFEKVEKNQNKGKNLIKIIKDMLTKVINKIKKYMTSLRTL